MDSQPQPAASADQPDGTPAVRRRRGVGRWSRPLVIAGALVAALAIALADVPVLSFLAWCFLVVAVLVGILWLLGRAYQAFFWRVGRRLTFSYFLIGVLPVPMVLLVGFLLALLISSFFVGHLLRDSVDKFAEELVTTAEIQLSGYARSGSPGAPRVGSFDLDYYRQGVRIGGAGTAPERWPTGLTETPPKGSIHQLARFVLDGGEGPPTMAMAVEQGELGVVAVYNESLAALLTQLSGAWVQLERPESESDTEVVQIQDTEMRFRTGGGRTDPAQQREKQAFFDEQADGDGWLDRPSITWVERIDRLTDLTSGETVEGGGIELTASPRLIARRLLHASSEQDLRAWIGLAMVAGILLTVYSVAVLLALAMVVGLGRAVNQLSRATSAVQAGDFSVRIPARRRDQLGALQRSFNQMAENLEALVTTSAQKEVLEKELEIARELQEGLLPSDLPRGEGVEFATLFEPSAAIGGDYFDILRLDEHRLAVVIADVSGHGLSSGLRMAMIKAALQILMDDRQGSQEILRRLDNLVRADGRQRFFVTATLAVVDLDTGTLALTNAGHLPTYLLRGGEVREILLPSSPLGGLGQHYATETVELAEDDVVVWLSDGLVEATDRDGEMFGFDGITDALTGGPPDAVAVRSRLVSAVNRHAVQRPDPTGGTRPDDDRTLVVMHYRKGRRTEEE